MDGGGDFFQRDFFQALHEGKRSKKLGQHKSLYICHITINRRDLPSPYHTVDVCSSSLMQPLMAHYITSLSPIPATCHYKKPLPSVAIGQLTALISLPNSPKDLGPCHTSGRGSQTWDLVGRAVGGLTPRAAEAMAGSPAGVDCGQ